MVYDKDNPDQYRNILHPRPNNPNATKNTKIAEAIKFIETSNATKATKVAKLAEAFNATEPTKTTEATEQAPEPEVELPPHQRPMTWEELGWSILGLGSIIATFFFITEILGIKFGPFY